MAKYKDDGKAYLEMYPQIAKRWINECVVCHKQGFKPEMPGRIDSNSNQAIMKNNLMRYFEPLFVDDTGLCEQCGQRFEKTT